MNSKLLSLVLFATAVTFAGTVYATGNLPYDVNQAHCEPNVACNNDNGCSWITHVYDYWYHLGECQRGSGDKGNCTMAWMLCNHHIDYNDSACSIFNTERYTYQYGCA